MDAPTGIETQIIESLRKVIDPDLGVNIVDLGFVRKVEVDGQQASLDVTLTNPFCPLTTVIEDQMRIELVGRGVLEDFDVSWVFDPPWCPDQVSEEGRKQLRSIGFASM
ncbi:MAG: metal-sulfur cluster assembly factor [bacterium]|nr:metal-sulfur cluster assembly factor [bacterium]MDE0289157.1 metal-sulfur cluster assembly factor [bacterium]MDE0377198.1 metal-sulfur cluster assembly factor [bacterium]